ncbi:dTDP-glucose 4,6-dehydratase, partial [Candidatus Micrarchaeota archaeon]
LREKWDRIYSVTAFYVGLSDDLGPYKYIEALDAVFAGTFDPYELTDENIDLMKMELAQFQPPKIYGGTGACEFDPPFTPEMLDECLDKTKGMRLMGQRFIPDSYVFSNLVAFNYLGTEQPFTMFAGLRAFPRGLDAMAILGSERAKELLEELGDLEYNGYDDAFNELQAEFNAFDAAEWNKNLYWSWLYSLKALLKEFGPGYPTFMQTQAWQDKELTAALASWAQLRHDTILYAKQSYTEYATSAPPPQKPVVGYVEPVPEFYNRLLALTRMTNEGLTEMEVLDSTSKYRLEALEEILERLVEISEKELENQELTEEDYDFIKYFGEELNDVIAEVDDKAKKTTIIADVHTDMNSGAVLEEGTGYVKFIVVAYKVPDGRILIGAGPVLSYYEFKHPMSDRLTDEKWRELLSSDPPDEPEWVPNFAS